MKLLSHLAASPAALLAAVLAFALSSCADLPTQGAQVSEEPSPAPAPERPFFGGAFLGDEASTPERIGPAIRDFAALTGKQPALVKTFHDLTCDFSAAGWCGRLVRGVVETGSTPYLALDVRWAGGPRTRVLEPLAAGEADAELARVARQIASLGGTVLVEPAWEMNGDWNYAWQGIANGADTQAPRKYREAWRRIVETFRREGATNVRWVFNPNVGNPVSRTATGAAHWNWYGNYYPGDAYVDYVGAHGFNAPRLWGGPWNAPGEMFDGTAGDHMLTDLAKRYPGKPIIIGEFSSDEAAPGEKGRWVRDAYRFLRSHPNVVGAVWFNMNKEADWRVNSSAASLEAYREAMADAGVRTAFRDVSPSQPSLAMR